MGPAARCRNDQKIGLIGRNGSRQIDALPHTFGEEELDKGEVAVAEI